MGFRFWNRPRICFRRITLEQLEERIVLDAAAGADQHDNPDHHDATQTAAVATPSAQGGGQQPAPAATGAPASPAAAGPSDTSLTQVVQHDLKVVLVPNALDKVEAISKAAVDGAQVVVYDAQHDNLASVVAGLDQLAQASGLKLGTIGIVGHGAEGVLTIGSDTINILNLSRYLPSFELLAHDMTEDAQIQFFSCSTAGNLLGQALLNGIALHTGADVFASVDATGGQLGNWVLEYSSDTHVAVHTLLEEGKLGSDSSALGLSDFNNCTFGISSLTAVESTDYKRLYFLAREPGTDPSDIYVPQFIWWTDILGSDPVKVDVPGVPGDVYGARLFGLIGAFDGKLLFTAYTDSQGYELYVHDPASGITRTVTDINPGAGSSDPQSFAELNGVMYFSAIDNGWSRDLWQYDPHGGADGLGSATQVLADGLPTNLAPEQLVAVQNELFFVGGHYHTPDDCSNIWKYDPASAIAVKLTNSPGGVNDLDPENLMACNGTLFFTAPHIDGGLHHYDASTGVQPVLDELGGGVYPSFGSAVNVAGTIFFFQGQALWTYEPGSDHAVLVTENSSWVESIHHPYAYGNLLLYMGNDYVHGQELWRSDGTAAGTFMLRDINQNTDTSTGDSIGYADDTTARAQFYGLSYDGYFLFKATDGGVAYGNELWQTDGTQAGTILAMDVNPGVADSNPTYLTKVNPLFFVADTGAGTGVFSWTVTPVVPPAAPGVPGLAAIVADVAVDPAAVKDHDGFSIHVSSGAHHGTTHPVDLSAEDGREGFLLGADIDLRGLPHGSDLGWERVLDWLGSLDAKAAGTPHHGLEHPEQFGDTGLFGWSEHVQDGAVLVFDLDHIRISSLVLDTDAGTAFKLPATASLDELNHWSDFEAEWMRLVDECRGRCTGSLGFVDLLLQTKPAGAVKNGPV